MKVFLSYARKDSALAAQLADRLTDAGFSVWDPEQEIGPGDNWAKKLGKALEDSDRPRQDIEFAIASEKYEGRFFTVFVGPTLEAGEDIPWILLKLPHLQIDSAAHFGRVVKEIQRLLTPA